MKKVYIYKLLDPRNNEVKYIGKTINLHRRMLQHLHESKKGLNRRYVINWIKGLLLEKIKPIMICIEECNNQNWQEREQYWISFYKKEGCKLCNLSEGGLGCKGKGSRINLTKEQREILSNRARKLFGGHNFEERLYFWNILKDNNYKECHKIDSRINRSMYFQVKTGRTWRDVTKLPKPKLKGKSIGTNHPAVKINEKIAEEIRVLKKTLTAPEIAKKYNISPSNVYNIVYNKIWKSESIPELSGQK